MDKVSEIKKRLMDVVGIQPNLPFNATITDVQDDHCSIRLASGLELSDVKLKATIDENSDYVLLTPVIGSDVVVLSFTGGLDNLFVIKVDRVSSVSIKRNGLYLQLDGEDQKVLLKNNEVGLKELFGDLAELLKTIKVHTPTGPSGTPLPDNIAAIQEFENKFKKLLK